MPLVPYPSNSFEDFFHSLDQEAEPKPHKGQKLLTVNSEEELLCIHQQSDATHIIISDQLDRIGRSAFEGFTQLRQVSIPNSITSVFEHAFAYCGSLSDIFLPDSVERIGNGAFTFCTSLASVRLPVGVTCICDQTFRGCTSLKEIFLPPSVQYIGDGAFLGCENLEAVYGGKGLIAIDADAFLGCKKLRHFPLHSGVCSIADTAFSDTPFCLPATYFSSKSPRASYGRSVIVPDGVRTIGAFAFSPRKVPASITLPDSVRNISREAFVNRDDLNSGGYDGVVTQDMIDRLPRRMNLPAGYLRQQTPYDWHMALTLCDTVWKDAVTSDDYEAIALYSGDPEVRYLVSLRLVYWSAFPPRKMMALPRENISHLEHLAEFICMFYPSMSLHDNGIEDIVKALYQEALDRGAAEAARLLERYCLYPELFGNDDGTTGLYEYSVSPFEAEKILGFSALFSGVYIGENDLHFTDGSRVPRSYIRVIFAEFVRPSVLEMLMSHRSNRIAGIALKLLRTLIRQIREEEWISFLRANREDTDVLRLLCFSADGDTLFALYDQYHTELADAEPYERVSRLSELYEAVGQNDSLKAQKISEWLAQEIRSAQEVMLPSIITQADNADTPIITEEPFDDADRWRMLNELEEVECNEPQDEPVCDDDGWGDLFSGTESDPFADFGRFADFDEYTEALFDQLDGEDPDEYEDDDDEEWDEYESDCIGDYEADDDEEPEPSCQLIEDDWDDWE